MKRGKLLYFDFIVFCPVRDDMLVEKKQVPRHLSPVREEIYAVPEFILTKEGALTQGVLIYPVFSILEEILIKHSKYELF